MPLLRREILTRDYEANQTSEKKDCESEAPCQPLPHADAGRRIFRVIFSVSFVSCHLLRVIFLLPVCNVMFERSNGRNYPSARNL